MGRTDPGPRSPGAGNVVQAPAHPLSPTWQQRGLELRAGRPVPSMAVSPGADLGTLGHF